MTLATSQVPELTLEIRKLRESLEHLQAGLGVRELTAPERFRALTQQPAASADQISAHPQSLLVVHNHRVIRMQIGDIVTHTSEFADLTSAHQFWVSVRNTHNQIAQVTMLGKAELGVDYGVLEYVKNFAANTIQGWEGLPWVPYLGFRTSYPTAPTNTGINNYLDIVISIQEMRAR